MEENTNLNLEPTLENEGQEQQKTFTEKEVMELLQKECDRRVGSALKKQKKDYEKQLSLSAGRTEARTRRMQSHCARSIS